MVKTTKILRTSAICWWPVKCFDIWGGRII